MASEEASILFALEQQENEEEERWIAEEKSVVEEEEAEEMRLEEMRLEAEKEADEARKAAEVAQSSWTIYVNMTEDSEWSPMSPYLMSLVMLQLCRGFWKGFRARVRRCWQVQKRRRKDF